LYLLLGCFGSTEPLKSDLAEYERCKKTEECGPELQCLGSQFKPVGDEDWATGTCMRDVAQHKALVDTLHARLAEAVSAAESADPNLPLSCSKVSAEGNHYIVESNWARAVAAGTEDAPHYIGAGVPSEFNGRLGPSAKMSDSDLVGTGRQVQWLLAKRYLGVSVEDELLFPEVDFQTASYVPGHVRARVYLYDMENKALVCGGLPFEGVAEKAETPSPAQDLQNSSRESLKDALAHMVPELTFYL
jgi:hypothetical protein